LSRASFVSLDSVNDMGMWWGKKAQLPWSNELFRTGMFLSAKLRLNDLWAV